LIGLVFLVLSGAALAYIHFNPSTSMPASAGGALGESLGQLAINALNVQGSTLLLIALFLFGLTVFTDLSWFKVMDLTGKITLDLIELIQSLVNRWWNARVERKQLVAQLREVDERVSEVSAPIVLDRREQAKVKERLIAREESLNKHMNERVNRPAPIITPPAAPKASEPSKRVFKEKQVNLFEDSALAGSLPPISILDVAEKVQKKYSPEYLEAMSRLLEIKLKEFGVEVIVESVHPGPVITRFEIQPAAGIKVSRISGLAKDLARSMAIISVRVVEVIPGKTTVGIEIPNEDRQIVRFSEVLSSPEYDDAKSPVTLALGHDIGGKPVITDLAKMPHLLVAGTTGSGKSVGVNAMILSILFKSTPEEARLIMIDPKMLELSIYEGIPHLLCPVVTDMKEAANALRWSVAEMERRYKLMSKMGVRNLAGFNRKVKDAIDAGEPLADPLYKRESMHDEAPLLKPLPTIVVVVDEFADMMMIVGKKVEELIARIAQKARAAGIHLILATQRPSVDVITGLIKANIPTRMAFQVSSKIDSRTILDQGGAEQLLGHGDMLYMPPGTSLPIRVHGAFVSDEEVHRVVEAWKLRGTPDYIDDILNGAEEAGSGFDGSGGEGGEDSEMDALYDEAVNFVLESRRASISAVQRKLKIGYNRAARMIEAMEMAGVVTSMNTNGSREVIAPSPVRD
jgi:S-DNA-T family DNA segregation ATPase FtsK/SpoIIIE